MIEDFKIQVFDLRKEFYIPLENLTSQTVTEENLFTIVKNKNLVMENRNKTTPEIFETFLAENQSFIPHYAMNASTSNFIFDENHNIKDIEYFKLRGHLNTSMRVGNNINLIISYIFKYWSFSRPDNLIQFTFVKNGETKVMYIGPGLLLDSNGKILFSLCYKKEIIKKLNSVSTSKFSKLRDFYNLFISNLDSTLPLENFLNENAILLFNKEFAKDPLYSRFYKPLVNIFSNGIKYSIDSIITDSIDKYIYNHPYTFNHELLNFKSFQEKKEFQKSILKKVLLT